VQRGARQNGLRVDSMSDYTDLKKRDAELAAHADFRKHLYAYDVVPMAEVVAKTLCEGKNLTTTAFLPVAKSSIELV